jgi:FkbM family methyltransferase
VRPRHHVRDVEALAEVLVESELFACREREGSDALSRYTLRESCMAVFLRHGSPDVGVLDEIFRQRVYDLPARVARRLRSSRRALRIVDLGANIGLFGLYVLGQLGDARITAYEPDRFNLDVLKRCIVGNGQEAAWRVVPACAGARAGVVPFLEGRFACSRTAPGEDAAGTTRVRVVDVFPALSRVHLLKADMEGGEWAVLTDPRFPAAGVEAIALEYHPHLCPGPSGARETAEVLLRDAGYAIEPLFERPDGVGMLWAWR